ncbi:MMPL family transporter [Paenibacillus sp. LHD-117]|uniref:MMPL family transporter n=1 Tax=Paenibacillus sp. LHD-117 TaxID=3071412 RepID=UPI0027E1FCE0|nr:MMPL family transporter [Paenibacillus sp. LHD-117]MDQ6420141.1 MMPL family transporter [Paenibacillus sp. LHD-117]
MRIILKLKWLVLALWVLAAAGLMAGAPNMEELVRTKGQITVPDGYSSTMADELAKDIGAASNGAGEGSKEGSSSEAVSGDEGGGMSTVLVFHKEGGLGEEGLAEAKATIEKLGGEEGKSLGVLDVTSHFDIPELKEQMMSEDGSTVLALLHVSAGERELAAVRDELYAAIDDVSVDHYYTGNWIINEDVVQSSQEGLKKTEFITVGFILVILFVVFRSAAAPLVPLLAVGFSYLVSQSIVAYLVEYVNFPLSNFTQIFMVAVLFGIGTDYCILLISRYKEELSHRGDRTEAIIHTYRTAGRTVLFSGLAVLVGFASIGFSTFVLYRSAVAVAVGVVILLLALFTLVPFFLAVLGNALFWPAKGTLEHKQSRLWGTVGSFSLRRPVWALVILLVLIVPFLTAYKGSISFNSLDEIGEKYDSVKGFNVIADGFSPGETLPTNVVIKSDQPLDTPEGLAALEQVSRELSKVEGVQAVRSVTRPTGQVLEDFLVSDQVLTLDDGLGKSGDGLSEISSGLAEASSALGDNAPKLAEAADGAGQLAAGTEELRSGVNQLAAGLRAIEKGLKDGTAGAAELTAGLEQANASAEELAAANAKLLESYQTIGGGLSGLNAGYESVAAEGAKLAEGLSGVSSGLSGLEEKYPELKDDEQFQETLLAVASLQQGAAQLSAGLKELNGQLAGVTDGMAQANAGYKQAAAGQSALAAGLGELAKGIAELQGGIAQAAAGQGAIIGQLPGVTQGLGELAAGQQELQAGFVSLNDQLGELTSGLDQSVDGLTQVTDGLASAGGYLQNLADAPDKELTGWHIPQEAIDDEQFQSSLDVYMSPDRGAAKFDVIFDSNPYSEDTMAEIASLEAAVDRALRGTAYEGAQSAIGGVTSMNHDLDTISNEDYTRTVILMLIGITLILIVLFRSIIIPAYVVISLLVTFYTSLAITEVIFVRMLGLTGISWAVPFFGFVLLVALGVDYSIFLMDRFREYRHLEPKQAILEAMKNMGSVIMSAAVILGGTFAAMLPSGVMSLLQIATMVLCGLFLYALVMLPLFIPVMVRVFGEANWWPFMRGDQAREAGRREQEVFVHNHRE